MRDTTERVDFFLGTNSGYKTILLMKIMKLFNEYKKRDNHDYSFFDGKYYPSYSLLIDKGTQLACGEFTRVLNLEDILFEINISAFSSKKGLKYHR